MSVTLIHGRPVKGPRKRDSTPPPPPPSHEAIDTCCQIDSLAQALACGAVSSGTQQNRCSQQSRPLPPSFSRITALLNQWRPRRHHHVLTAPAAGPSATFVSGKPGVFARGGACTDPAQPWTSDSRTTPTCSNDVVTYSVSRFGRPMQPATQSCDCLALRRVSLTPQQAEGIRRGFKTRTRHNQSSEGNARLPPRKVQLAR